MNKNVSVWKGKDTPPSFHHLWYKTDDENNVLGEFKYNFNSKTWEENKKSGDLSVTPRLVDEVEELYIFNDLEKASIVFNTHIDPNTGNKYFPYIDKLTKKFQVAHQGEYQWFNLHESPTNWTKCILNYTNKYIFIHNNTEIYYHDIKSQTLVKGVLPITWTDNFKITSLQSNQDVDVIWAVTHMANVTSRSVITIFIKFNESTKTFEKVTELIYMTVNEDYLPNWSSYTKKNNTEVIVGDFIITRDNPSMFFQTRYDENKYKYCFIDNIDRILLGWQEGVDIIKSNKITKYFNINDLGTITNYDDESFNTIYYDHNNKLNFNINSIKGYPVTKVIEESTNVFKIVDDYIMNYVKINDDLYFINQDDSWNLLLKGKNDWEIQYYPIQNWDSRIVLYKNFVYFISNGHSGVKKVNWVKYGLSPSPVSDTLVPIDDTLSSSYIKNELYTVKDVYKNRTSYNEITSEYNSATIGGMDQLTVVDTTSNITNLSLSFGGYFEHLLKKYGKVKIFLNVLRSGGTSVRFKYNAAAKIYSTFNFNDLGLSSGKYIFNIYCYYNKEQIPVIIMRYEKLTIVSPNG